MNHLIILIIIIIFLQATNCTKNLMTFVDLTDDWKVFIGRGDIAQQEAWAVVPLSLFSNLSPMSF